MNLIELARKPVTVLETTPVIEAAQEMAAKGVGSVEVVTSDGEILGIFTERDLMTRVVARQLPLRETPVGKVMTRSVATLPPFGSPDEALRTMILRRIRHLPIVDNTKRLVGILRFQDLFAHQVDALGTELDSVIARYTVDAPGG